MPKQTSKKVILCISNDIHTDQRLHKVCTSLKSRHYNVELLGRKLPSSKSLNRDYSCKRLSILVNSGFLFYAFLNIQFFIYLLFKRVDLIVANDLDTLPACHLASKLKRKPLIVDLHELFSEVPEVVARPKVQKVWKRIESYYLPKQKHVITVCKSIADHYEKLYGIHLEVVRNIPMRNEDSIENIQKNSHITLLYQGAVNLGRGIETMVESMVYLPSQFKLWIVGSGDLSENISNLITENNVQDRVKMFGRVEPEELKKLTPQAHLGLSLEENLGLNYYYALPNKLFDYLHAQIPMVVSPFPEMSAIVEGNNIGYIRQSVTSEGLALEIKEIFSDETVYQEKMKACESAKEKLIWENEFESYFMLIQRSEVK
ncbi:MAG: glycosyltransferase [Flavobacteriales bacterium]